MTEPPSDDRQLDAAIAHLVEAAGSDAPAAPDASSFTLINRSESGWHKRRGRWMTAGAVGLVAATGAFVLLVIDDDGSETLRSSDPSLDTLPSTTPTDDTVAASASPPVEPSAPASTTPTAPPTTMASTAATGISRPLVAADRCEPVYAREGITPGISFFARSFSSNPVPVQILGDPAAGPTGPFALVQRYFGDDRRSTGEEAVDIDGTTYWISTFDNGNGGVEWDVGDGSLGYLRSRGLDRDTLVQIVASLTPRPAAAAVPGFDYDIGRETPVGLRLLHEQINADVGGEVGLSECAVASTGYRYRISAITGDPVFQYGGVLDRPVPLAIGIRDGTLIVINGLADTAAPTVDEVVDAEPAMWLELQSRPNWPENPGPSTDAIREGSDVVVPLVPADATVTTSYLTLRLSTKQGVTFLEVDKADVVLAPDAAFWRTETSLGTGGISTARVGGVLGFRIGDAPIRDPVEVTVSVIDGGDFVLQSTGPLMLEPQG